MRTRYELQEVLMPLDVSRRDKWREIHRRGASSTPDELAAEYGFDLEYIKDIIDRVADSAQRWDNVLYNEEQVHATLFAPFTNIISVLLSY